MRRNGYVIGAVALALLLAGCAGRDGTAAPAPATPPPVTGQPVAAEPTALIGSWTVTGTGVPADTVLRLADRELSVFQGCEMLSGEWRADEHGIFLGDVSGATALDDRRCVAPQPHTPEWLRRATGFQGEGDGLVLLDERGTEVARLRPGARPSGGPNLDPSQVEPPVATDEARRRLAPAAALPVALTPPGRDGLVGRWVPAAGERSRDRQPYVEFRADGTWLGSDGCNATRGRWATGPGGAVLATGGVSTLVGCDNVPVGAWLTTARRTGLDGAVLVLLDAAGAETGRLARQG